MEAVAESRRSLRLTGTVHNNDDGGADGLLLSAISWKSGVTANFLLPLVMITQIVFSVVVVRDVKSYKNGPYDGFFRRGSDSPAAAKLSYLTLSRWGDRAIRPLQDDKPSSTDYWRAMGVLGATIIVLPLLAGIVVCWTQPALMRLKPFGARISSLISRLSNQQFIPHPSDP